MVWDRLFAEEPLDETKLRIELSRLLLQVNTTPDMSLKNKTVEEIYKYVQELRKQVPVNPHNFNYIINPRNVCDGIDVFIISYIHSAPTHYKRRTAIRETWGDPRNFDSFVFRLVFLIGKSTDKNVQEALLMESDRYGDVVQEDFTDSYRNLTYKGIMGLKWVTRYCRHAAFILKTDDDIFVNIFNVASHLQGLQKREGQVSNLLLCLVWYRMKVVRDPKSKWYLSRSEFRDDYFPTYCSGSAFMMSTDVAAEMYRVSAETAFFWVDDFYITGLLAKKVGVKHVKFNSVYALGPSTFLDKFTEESKWRTLTFGHVHNLNHMSRVWKKVLADRRPLLHAGSNKHNNESSMARYFH
ncbi:hypothetical protein LSH36_320g07016 [Paralvinella palmiformis]|uniref:Hexosyltransferase n=1 Tax=Paralvinella palmiformis TaxID=53620 RepID=A0AAD9JGY0_9ANNE|nr:hypothetical protein LSH36_320g07016 [Paralvinella palmiformis]